MLLDLFIGFLDKGFEDFLVFYVVFFKFFILREVFFLEKGLIMVGKKGL